MIPSNLSLIFKKGTTFSQRNFIPKMDVESVELNKIIPEYLQCYGLFAHLHSPGGFSLVMTTGAVPTTMVSFSFLTSTCFSQL